MRYGVDGRNTGVFCVHSVGAFQLSEVLAEFLFGATGGSNRISPFAKLVNVFVKSKVLVETNGSFPSDVVLIMDVVKEEIDSLGFFHVAIMTCQVTICGEEDIDEDR